jgi:1-deoxy-D-xylulose-5-phosphate reductoisomerase
MDAPLRVTILGSTGSIGASTLDVVARHPARFQVMALTAHRDVEGLLAQCRAHRPRFAVMADVDAAERLRRALREVAPETEVLAGREALVQVAGLSEVDAVMAAIVGAAGLLPTLEAARRGKRVLLANKEALVMSGALFMDEVRRSGAVLLPIDSEHNAVFQCMPAGFVSGQRPAGVRRILLTASGGPFRDTPAAELEQVTPEQACAHPNWDMGRKISVDSATMMNKGLEVIEACWLFAMQPVSIPVVIHPQSVVHSMVEYDDGSVLAQMGNPDMRTPIAHGLAWPERVVSGVQPLDLLTVGRLDFQAPDAGRFPCLGLAMAAWARGGTAAATLNAANEVAVQSFLDGDLSFPGVARIIEGTLERCAVQDADSLDRVLAADREARRVAAELIRGAARRAG